MKFSTLATVLSLTLLASCGGGGGGGGSKESKSSSAVKANTKTYVGKCNYDSRLDKYVRSVVTITKTEGDPIVTIGDDLFLDSACAKVKLSVDFPIFAISEPAESTMEGYTYGVSYRPRSKEIVKEMNKERVCDRSDWKLNQGQDVTNSSCEQPLSGKISLVLEGKSMTVTLCPDKQSSCSQLILQKK